MGQYFHCRRHKLGVKRPRACSTHLLDLQLTQSTWSCCWQVAATGPTAAPTAALPAAPALAAPTAALPAASALPPPPAAITTTPASTPFTPAAAAVTSQATDGCCCLCPLPSRRCMP